MGLPLNSSDLLVLQLELLVFILSASSQVVNSLSLLPQVINLATNLACFPSLPTTTVPLPLDNYLSCATDVLAAKQNAATNPDTNKKTDEIARAYGYNVEVHNVFTRDGYILAVHRITGSPVSPPARRGKPSVYVHHGLGGASDNWVLQHGNRNLAFKLADAGYDVWLANCRGSTYSLGHTSLNSEADLPYWDFSFHEMALYDIPATMDKISQVSGNQRMYYIGFSMGTTVFFVSMSELPQLNSRIIAAFLLSPVAHVGHSSSVIRTVAQASLGTGQQYLLNPVLRGRLEPAQQLETLTGHSLGDLCTPIVARCTLCDNVMFALFGFDTSQMNYTNLPNILSKYPNIMSIKSLAHYAQLANSCDFRQFDYGPNENLEKYGTTSPPVYNLSKITAKTYFYHGLADSLVVPADVELTRSRMLPSTVVENYRVDWKLWNHADFQIAKDADVLLYNRVVSTMNGIPPV